MKHVRYLFLLLLCFTATTHIAVGQTVESLNKEIARAEKEIAKKEKLLKEVSQSKKNNLTELKLVESRITSRNKIIDALDKKTTVITKDISQNKRQINGLNKEIEALKKEYADLVYVAYKNYKLNNELLFLFSAQDFNDATKRLNFIRKYNQMRAEMAAVIDSRSATIQQDVTNLSLQQEELNKNKTAHGREVNSLKQDQKEHSTTAKKMQREEGKINKELSAQREKKRKAQNAIQKIIDREISRSKSKTTDQERRRLTELTGKFGQNRGKLLLPVNSGVIIDHYGKRQHPTQRNLTVDNKGINIIAPRGADVFVVFDGTVSRVGYDQWLNNFVIVRHGNYFTVYSNLATVDVKNGEKVATSQKLGEMSKNSDNDGCLLHFELWKSNVRTNPEVWFAK